MLDTVFGCIEQTIEDPVLRKVQRIQARVQLARLVLLATSCKPTHQFPGYPHFLRPGSLQRLDRLPGIQQLVITCHNVDVVNGSFSLLI